MTRDEKKIGRGMVMVYTGWSWRIARLISVDGGRAIVQFSGTDERLTVDVDKCRRIDYAFQPSNKWRILEVGR